MASLIFQKKEYSFLYGTTVVLVCLNLLWLAYTIGYIEGKNEALGFSYRNYNSHFLYVRLALALVINSVGLRLKNLKGLIVSFTALIWILVEYLLWHLSSTKWLESLGVSNINDLPPIVHENIPFVGGFYGGTWWTLCVLLMTLLLTLWVGKIFYQVWYSNGPASHLLK